MYSVLIVIPAPWGFCVDLYPSRTFPNHQTQQVRADTIHSRPHLERNNRELIIANYCNSHTPFYYQTEGKVYLDTTMSKLCKLSLVTPRLRFLPIDVINS